MNKRQTDAEREAQSLSVSQAERDEHRRTSLREQLINRKANIRHANNKRVRSQKRK